MSNGTEQRKLAAIMFTDMVGYSALAQRNEALALELLEEHHRPALSPAGTPDHRPAIYRWVGAEEQSPAGTKVGVLAR